MLGKFITVTTFLSAIIIIFFMQTTNPSSVGPGGILAVFFLLYVFFLGIFTWLIYFISVIAAQVTKPVTIKKPLEVISMKQAYYHASILGIAPIMLIGMSSVGKLGVYEILLVAAFVAIGEFYVQKRT